MLSRTLSLLLLSLVVTACSPESSNAPSTESRTASSAASSTAPSAEPTAERSAKVGIFYLEGSLDPKNMFDAWVLMRVGAAETLLRLSDDGSLKPWLCQAYRVVDPLNYELTLQPGLTFSDGSPVHAAAVKACLERVYALNPRALQYFKLDHITVHDDLRLTITTQEPVPELFYNLCEPLFSIIKLPQDASATIELPITTGPYQVTAFVPNQSVTVQANRHYRKQVPLLDQIDFLYQPEEQARTMALQSGQVALIPTVNYATLPLFTDKADFQVLRRISPRTNVVYINHDNALLARKELRQALELALNRAQIVSLIGGTPAASLIAPDLVQGFAPKSAYDPERARQLLDEAGIIDHNGNGTRDFQGQELSFNYYFKADHGSADSALIAQCLQQDWAPLGIKLNLYPAENLAAIMAAGDFDFFSANDSTLPTGDPYVFMYSRFHRAGDANFGHYANPQVEALLAAMAQTFDSAPRQALTHELLTELKADVSALFINHIEINEVANQHLRDLHLYSFDYYFIDDQVRYE